MNLELAEQLREGDLIAFEPSDQNIDGAAYTSWWYLLKNLSCPEEVEEREYITFLMIQMYSSVPSLFVHSEIVRYTFYRENINSFRIISRSGNEQ